MSHTGGPGRDVNPGDAWTVLAHLLSGLLVWGGAGALLDRVLGTGFALPVGLLVGMATALYLVYIRYGRETT